MALSASSSVSSSTLTSTFIDADGPVHVADFGGPAGAPLLVLVHGLASSHAGWGSLAAQLTADHRVLAVDLPGHGRSPAAGRSTAVLDSSDVLARIVEQLDEPVTLVGHSMGAAASLLAAASLPDRVERMILLAPPMPQRAVTISAAVLPHVAMCLWPWAGRQALRRRLSRAGTVEHVMNGLRRTCGSLEQAARLAPALAAELELALEAGEDPSATFIEAARSVGLLVTHGETYRDAIAGAGCPVLVLHGELDRVLPAGAAATAETLRPDWDTRVLTDVGHSPHMEEPAYVAGLMSRFLTATDADLSVDHALVC